MVKYPKMGVFHMGKSETKKADSRHSGIPGISGHHIVYPSPEHPEQEVVVRVRKSEHLVLTRMSWYCRKTVSRGFIKALDVFLALNRDRAVEV